MRRTRVVKIYSDLLRVRNIFEQGSLERTFLPRRILRIAILLLISFSFCLRTVSAQVCTEWTNEPEGCSTVESAFLAWGTSCQHLQNVCNGVGDPDSEYNAASSAYISMSASFCAYTQVACDAGDPLMCASYSINCNGEFFSFLFGQSDLYLCVRS